MDYRRAVNREGNNIPRQLKGSEESDERDYFEHIERSIVKRWYKVLFVKDRCCRREKRVGERSRATFQFMTRIN